MPSLFVGFATVVAVLSVSFYLVAGFLVESLQNLPPVNANVNLNVNFCFIPVPSPGAARYQTLVAEHRAKFAQTIQKIIAISIIIAYLDRNLAFPDLPLEQRIHFTILRYEYQFQRTLEDAHLAGLAEAAHFTDPPLF